MIRILVVDDSVAIQEGLSSLLNRQPDLDVVGTARDGVEAVAKVRELVPDVVIMDAQMPNMDGVEATAAIKQSFSQVGVLFFTVFPDCIEASINAGADGYLLKDCEMAELLAKVQDIGRRMQAAKSQPGEGR